MWLKFFCQTLIEKFSARFDWKIKFRLWLKFKNRVWLKNFQTRSVQFHQRGQPEATRYKKSTVPWSRMHPKRCETCRHAIKKTRRTSLHPFLCKASGMIREPVLPELWILWIGCFWYDMSPWIPVTEDSEPGTGWITPSLRYYTGPKQENIRDRQKPWPYVEYEPAGILP